jgi:protein involved in polysaccharide export with SLBB domain
MRLLLFAPLLLLLICSCASRPPEVAAPEPIVRPGDCLVVQFTSLPVPEIRQTIDSEGEITLPLIGKLRVTGMTLRQIHSVIMSAFAPRSTPHFTVSFSRC